MRLEFCRVASVAAAKDAFKFTGGCERDVRSFGEGFCVGGVCWFGGWGGVWCLGGRWWWGVGGGCVVVC